MTREKLLLFLYASSRLINFVNENAFANILVGTDKNDGDFGKEKAEKSWSFLADKFCYKEGDAKLIFDCDAGHEKKEKEKERLILEWLATSKR